MSLKDYGAAEGGWNVVEPWEPRFAGWDGVPSSLSTSTKTERRSAMDRPANQSVPINGRSISVLRHEPSGTLQQISNLPTVVVATVDPAISNAMRELLQIYPLRTIWVRGMNEVRDVVAKQNVAACFCGFWLVDGTYRDIVRHLRRQPV
jgi:hypothetical protein